MNKIKELRKLKGKTQKEFAEAMNVAQNTVSQWESGTRSVDTDTIVKMAEYFGVSVNYLLGIEDKRNVYRIPIYSAVAAGNPIFTDNEVIAFEEIPKDWGDKRDFFGIRIKGDSMLPRFVDGDFVIVKKQDDVDDGDLAIVMVNGDEATFKQVRKQENGLTLIGYNLAEYTPRFYSCEEIEQLPVQILGKVIELRAKL